jgi:hypothetical protein
VLGWTPGARRGKRMLGPNRFDVLAKFRVEFNPASTRGHNHKNQYRAHVRGVACVHTKVGDDPRPASLPRCGRRTPRPPQRLSERPAHGRAHRRTDRNGARAQRGKRRQRRDPTIGMTRNHLLRPPRHRDGITGPHHQRLALDRYVGLGPRHDHATDTTDLFCAATRNPIE